MTTRTVACLAAILLASEPAPAAITVFNLNPPEISTCGRVDLNGIVLSDPPLEVNRISFAWGSTTRDQPAPANVGGVKSNQVTMSVR